MKIRDIKDIVASPGRNFVTIKGMITDAGPHGIGDDTAKGREQAVARRLDGTMCNW